MKLITTTDHTKKHYNSLCLENMRDAEYFTNMNAAIKSRQSISFWMGFKSQTFRHDPMDYLCHEVRDNAIGAVLGTQMGLKARFRGEGTSIAEYCNDSDTLISNMNTQILKYIHEGRMVRVGELGGYCPTDSLDDCVAYIDINEEEATRFLLHKDINFKFEINKETVVIENDDYFPKRLIEDFCKITQGNPDDIQVFSSFKHRSILFEEEDYVRFFSDGVSSGMKNILFQTTAQDQSQIRKMKGLLEFVMSKNIEKSITVYAKVDDEHRSLFKTKLPNIKVVFIKRY